MSVNTGATFVFRRKFSATSFFADCATYDCSIAQYIGELCRYLLNSTPQASETNHKLRMMIGNGLRPEIWKNFETRFRIPIIFEFYAATE